MAMLAESDRAGAARSSATVPAPTSAEEAGVGVRWLDESPLVLHLGGSAFLAALMLVLWALTGGGTFWPMWVWFGLAVAFGVHALLRAALSEPRPSRLERTRHWFLFASGVEVTIWILSGGGAFWPIWPILGFGSWYLALLALSRGDTLPWRRARALADRVDVLTRTRRGALDVQAEELRRIERDLHDGAQARLVALSMRLGRAEQRLQDGGDEATRALVLDAQRDAEAAIGELRDLARGIAPPILADRGLLAAAQALGRRCAIPVAVEGTVARRPSPVVESAAYFVIAESLTNAAKHAGPASATVRLGEEQGRLVVEIADDGRGGADAAGSGLTGLRRRVEALDGRLAVSTPEAGGTLVRAELPHG